MTRLAGHFAKRPELLKYFARSGSKSRSTTRADDFLFWYENSSLPVSLGELPDWMADKGPAVWHVIALGWNWDNGLDTPHWIISQPHCDAATAAHIFFHAALTTVPGEMNENRQQTGTPLSRTLCTRIIALWRRRYYTSRKFHPALPISLETECHKAELACKCGDGVIWHVPEDMYGPFEGMEARTDYVFENDELRLAPHSVYWHSKKIRLLTRYRA